jgi:hypothetical protein
MKLFGMQFSQFSSYLLLVRPRHHKRSKHVAVSNRMNVLVFDGIVYDLFFNLPELPILKHFQSMFFSLANII